MHFWNMYPDYTLENLQNGINPYSFEHSMYYTPHKCVPTKHAASHLKACISHPR